MFGSLARRRHGLVEGGRVRVRRCESLVSMELRLSDNLRQRHVGAEGVVMNIDRHNPLQYLLTVRFEDSGRQEAAVFSEDELEVVRGGFSGLVQRLRWQLRG